jgi:hypothetical protein
LNNTLLNNQWVKKEITRRYTCNPSTQEAEARPCLKEKKKSQEIRKYLETNENINTTYQNKNLWDKVKAVLKGKCIAINT